MTCWLARLLCALVLLEPVVAGAQPVAASAPGTTAAAASAPGHAHRQARQLAVGAAFAPDAVLWVVALNPQGQLFTQVSSDEGRSWSAPRIVATGSDRIAADGENRPKIAFGPRGQAVITYTEPLSKPYTGQIRMLRSDDGGQSFSAPFTVHADRQLITHRFESVAFDARGTLHTLWVDKRDLEAAQAAARAAAPAAAASAAPATSGRRPRAESAYRGAAIYRNESSDGGKTFGPDIKLADHSCECCRIALAPAPDGSLAAMWRHVFAPNERDHGFALLSGPPKAEPVRASFDRWALDACPHHGPGLSPAAGGGWHAVWFGERGGDARVRYGQLAPDGTPRGAVQALPDERAEHASVHSVGASLAISWRSFDGQATRWRAWVSSNNGQSFTLHELGATRGDNDHPLLLARGAQIHALWRTPEGIRVERLLP